MAHILYSIIIYPITLLIEIILQFGEKLFNNTVIAILGVSTAVSLFCLPLYIIAERWQQKERAQIAKLKPKVDKIKEVFKGDEQYMILATFYKQNHYHPFYAFRNSLGLLIQIPFFIAAYTFLSNYTPLQGESFFAIADLAKPDALISIKNYSINILPIIMTAINCLASAIYTKGLSLKDKIQLYGMAFIFLILLYNSPSGLVIYWTMNNVISLVKNIFYKLRNPKQVLYILCTILCVLLIIFDLFILNKDLYDRIILALIVCMIPLFPIISKLYTYSLKTIFTEIISFSQKRFILFALASTLIFILIGLNIPTSIIASSPQEFSFVDKHSSPLYFIYVTSLQAFGLFVVWPSIFYSLFSPKIKVLITICMVFTAIAAVINTFAFSGNYGILSTMLTFTQTRVLKPTSQEAVINIICICLIISICIYCFYKYKSNLITFIMTITFIAIFITSFINIISIQKGYTNLVEIKKDVNQVKTVSPIFSLSKTGKNVFIIMLDRAANGYVPTIFNENPELYSQYDGFIYYPNTLSFNDYTLIGAPPLFGGYEYTPQEINKRSSEKLKEKHNEALLVLPRIFSEAGFDTVITDPPWSNYSLVPDVSIYKPYPSIKPYITNRTYTDIWLKEHDIGNMQIRSSILERNFLFFGLLKISPLFIRDIIYDDGAYWNSDSQIDDIELLINSYSVLDYLPKLTEINTNTQNNTFTFMVNDLTHEPMPLQTPDYIPHVPITQTGNTPFSDEPHYPVNAAALKLIGKWLKFLKENNVYDNTRIIITSDHGANITSKQFSYQQFPFNPETHNPLLLVKDFNQHSSEFNVLNTDYTLMTNADVPILAVQQVIKNPLNPFTGKQLTSEIKQDKLYVVHGVKWTPDAHMENIFNIKPEQWYSVKDNILQSDNWKQEHP